MRRKSITFVLLFVFIATACTRPTPTPTATSVSPTATPLPATLTLPPPTPVPPTPTPVPTPAVEPLYLSIIWHQHQPLYFKDPETGVYVKPWVRVHATKDYLDMATTLVKYPKVKATFNLTPSLLRQLDDLSAGAKDLYWVMAEKRADSLTDEDKAFIIARFFDINPKIIARFPRYRQLAANRANSANWSEGDWRDLQVLFNLAWTDPDWLAREPLKALVDKAHDYTEADKVTLFTEQLRIIRQVIPQHAEMQRAGQIEITMTPYYHPILPLLVDTNLARVAVPDLPLPSIRFTYGQDAVAQIREGVELYRAHFGQPPRGMWPAEGAVAQQIVGMVSRAGIRWMASDEEVLARSLGITGFSRNARKTVKDPDKLYRPYYVTNKKDPAVAIIFRDHLLSDKVGFTYSRMPGKDAAQDFVRRLHDIQDMLAKTGATGPHLVSVILDGENAWEHYPNDGKEFLNTLYQLLSEDERIITVTPSEFIEMFPDQPTIETLWAGSWVTPDFTTWIGEDEENTAWEYLARTRDVVRKYESGVHKTNKETLDKALERIYAAEGSDWFWWYGADQNSGDDESFDLQFRRTLMEVYKTLGLEIPIWLQVPIISQRAQPPKVSASGLISPTIDGIAANREWDAAGYYDGADVIARLYYGFDNQNLYIRVDTSKPWDQATEWPAFLGFYLTAPGGGPGNPLSTTQPNPTLLGFNAQKLVQVGFSEDGKADVAMLSADGEGNWQDMMELPDGAWQGGTLELAIPFAALGRPDAGEVLKLRTILSEATGEGPYDRIALPQAGPAALLVPELALSTTVLRVEDPAGDDNGPGSYTYPTDPVFPAKAYDLKTFEVAYDDENIIFKFTFYGPLNNDWGAPNGMGIHTLDVYIDQDSVEGSGARLLLPGRNASVSPADAWDVAIWAEGWTPGVYAAGPDGKPQKMDVPLNIVSDPGQHRITIRVPKQVLGDTPEQWKYLAAVLSQEGYPSSGVWRVRDVLPKARQWRIGGAPPDTNHTRILDVALPADYTPTQAELLSDYPPSSETNMDALGADDFARLPMLTP
ncbi:MAG TPA: glycoside hydrolase [Anaerolineae bacterium]|nr:glycoside hydrolase [Anaerolineae bacterium]HIQ05953.1 glycoside hydrolase [Anaerolineae bacterium]